MEINQFYNNFKSFCEEVVTEASNLREKINSSINNQDERIKNLAAIKLVAAVSLAAGGTLAFTATILLLSGATITTIATAFFAASCIVVGHDAWKMAKNAQKPQIVNETVGAVKGIAKGVTEFVKKTVSATKITHDLKDNLVDVQVNTSDIKQATVDGYKEGYAQRITTGTWIPCLWTKLNIAALFDNL